MTIVRIESTRRRHMRNHCSLPATGPNRNHGRAHCLADPPTYSPVPTYRRTGLRLGPT